MIASVDSINNGCHSDQAKRVEEPAVVSHSGNPVQGLAVALSAAWMGKRKLLLPIALLIGVGSCASLAAPQQPPSVHDLAQRVDRHYNQLHSLRAQFTETYEGLGRSRSESGTLLLQKPGRMRWDYSTPAGKLFVLDGKYAFFYTRGDQQVQRIAAKQLDDLRSPLRFLLGHTQLEKEIDHLTQKSGPDGTFILTGVPHDQEKRVQRLDITATPEGAIISIEIQETDGAVTRFTFNGEQPNVQIPPSIFRFTPPPGVPVVDALGPA